MKKIGRLKIFYVLLRSKLRNVFGTAFLVNLSAWAVCQLNVMNSKPLTSLKIIDVDLPLVIWLVDDDPISSVMFRMESQRTGLGLQTADFVEPQSALAALRSMSEVGRFNALPCCIFLDLHMPGMTGWQFIEEMRKVSLPRGIAVFVVSSTEDQEDYARAASTPEVVSLMPKPLTAEKIKTALQTLDPAACEQTF